MGKGGGVAVANLSISGVWVAQEDYALFKSAIIIMY